MQFEVKGEDWLWVLGSLSHLNGIAFDADLLKREFSPPLDSAALIRAAQTLGLVLAKHPAHSRSVAALPTPLVAWLRTAGDSPEASGASDAANGASSPRKPALILRADADRLLYLEASSDIPHTVPAEHFASLFESEVLLVKRRAEAAKDPDARDQFHKFGLRWFLPEFLKHRRIWRDVLLVSAAVLSARPACDFATRERRFFRVFLPQSTRLDR